MNAIELAEECGAVILGGVFMLDVNELQAFYEAAKKEGHDELQAKLQEEGEALKLRVARLVDTLHKLACLGNGDNYGNSIGNTMAQDALSAEADQRWLLDKQAEALESAAKWFDATEYCAREHGEITAYAENELRRMASELRKQGEVK